jgi:hypothetical protein
MFIDLIKIFSKWRDLEEFTESKKTFYPKANLPINGEFLIEITKSITVTHLNQTINVEVIKEMCTQNVAKGTIKPDVDIITLNKMIREIDYEFLTKYIQAEKDLFQIDKS